VIRTSRVATPVMLPPGWSNLETKPWATGSEPVLNTIGIWDSRDDRGNSDNGHAAPHHLCNQCGHASIVTVGEALPNGYVAAFDKAHFSQALTDRGLHGRVGDR
jgi:hypothetical protein